MLPRERRDREVAADRPERLAPLSGLVAPGDCADDPAIHPLSLQGGRHAHIVERRNRHNPRFCRNKRAGTTEYAYELRKSDFG